MNTNLLLALPLAATILAVTASAAATTPAEAVAPASTVPPASAVAPAWTTAPVSAPQTHDAMASAPPQLRSARARAPARVARSSGWVYPIGPPGGPVEVVRPFDPPAQPWLAGHRGVDLAGTDGAEVRSAGPGTVAYAGPLAGRGVVVVDHGTVRTTYEPVTPSVARGDPVGTAMPVGTLDAIGSHCAPSACLHWGAREGDRYVDPLALVDGGGVRLLPLGDRTLTGAPPPAPPPVPPSSAALIWPVAAPRVTSPFGMRVHPITGERKLHDGTDFAAACGAPVRAAAAGRVTQVGDRGPYGLQVTVEHGRVRGTPVTTSYSHLSAFSVTTGQPLPAGQAVGRAGSTGLSTGCHLHFMVYAAGRITDPLGWLPTPSAKTSYLAAAARQE